MQYYNHNFTNQDHSGLLRVSLLVPGNLNGRTTVTSTSLCIEARQKMVQLTRSYSWEEFRFDFLYEWIEMLRILDRNYDATSTALLLWMLVAYALAVVLFVTACSLMLIFYRRVDPRYPNMRPQPFTFLELFLDLKTTGQKGYYERRTRLPDDSSTKSAETTGQGSGPQHAEAEPIEKSEVVPIVATSTPLVTPARTSAETAVASRTPLVTPGRKSAEPLISKGTQSATPDRTSAEQVPGMSREKVERSRPIQSKPSKIFVARTQGSSEIFSKERTRSQEQNSRESLILRRTPHRSKSKPSRELPRERSKQSKERSKEHSNERSKERSRERSKEHSSEQAAPTVPTVRSQKSVAKSSTVSMKGGSKKVPLGKKSK